MINLRPYQQSLVNRVDDALTHHRRVVAQTPTGGGKTVVAAFLIARAVAAGKRCYFVCHRQELIDQTCGTFAEFGIEHGIIAAGYPEQLDAPVQVISIDTFVRRIGRYATPDLVIVDECHHAVAATWTRVLESWNGAEIVGITATPQRLDGRGLEEIFEVLVLGPQTAELISQGHLSDYTLYGVPVAVDWAKIRRTAGDFNARDVTDALSHATVIGDVVRTWKLHARGLKTVLFASTVRHSEALVAAFRAEGVRAEHLDANTRKDERRAKLRAFAEGKVDVVSNVALFSEGFDLSRNAGLDVTIDCVISARPTDSLTIWLQQVGRALRPKADGRKAIILDHAGNWTRHDLPDAPREWSIDAGEKQPASEETVRQCAECFAILPPRTEVCDECGAPIPKQVRELREDESVELVEVDVEALRAERKSRLEAWREENALVFADLGEEGLIELAKVRGQSNPLQWAADQASVQRRDG